MSFCFSVVPIVILHISETGLRFDDLSSSYRLLDRRECSTGGSTSKTTFRNLLVVPSRPICWPCTTFENVSIKQGEKAARVGHPELRRDGEGFESKKDAVKDASMLPEVDLSEYSSKKTSAGNLKKVENHGNQKLYGGTHTI